MTDQVIRVPTPDVDKCEECGKPIAMGDHVAYLIEKDGITHRYWHKECLDVSCTGMPLPSQHQLTTATVMTDMLRRIEKLEAALRAICQRGAHMSVGPAADMVRMARGALGKD